MSQYTMPPEVIGAVKSAGFDVYMRGESDSWLLFTDGTRIGYLENSCATGLRISTVHKPNTHSGTGFAIVDGLAISDLTRDKLSEGFLHAPDWGRHIASVRKWRDFEAFKEANSFNRAYRKI